MSLGYSGYMVGEVRWIFFFFGLGKEDAIKCTWVCWFGDRVGVVFVFVFF